MKFSFSKKFYPWKTPKHAKHLITHLKLAKEDIDIFTYYLLSSVHNSVNNSVKSKLPAFFEISNINPFFRNEKRSRRKTIDI